MKKTTISKTTYIKVSPISWASQGVFSNEQPAVVQFQLFHEGLKLPQNLQCPVRTFSLIYFPMFLLQIHVMASVKSFDLNISHLNNSQCCVVYSLCIQCVEGLGKFYMKDYQELMLADRQCISIVGYINTSMYMQHQTQGQHHCSESSMETMTDSCTVDSLSLTTFH